MRFELTISLIAMTTGCDLRGSLSVLEIVELEIEFSLEHLRWSLNLKYHLAIDAVSRSFSKQESRWDIQSYRSKTQERTKPKLSMR